MDLIIRIEGVEKVLFGCWPSGECVAADELAEDHATGTCPAYGSATLEQCPKPVSDTGVQPGVQVVLLIPTFEEHSAGGFKVGENFIG